MDDDDYWNKFSEKKPEELGTYLVCNNRGLISVDIYTGHSWMKHPNGVAYWGICPSAPVECMLGAYDLGD